MMEILHIAAAALIGTSLMTLFSYMVSNKREQQFREPELLNQLLSRGMSVKIAFSRKGPAGWVLHYLMGMIFALAYYLFWKFSKAEPSLLSGALLGAANGVIGIAGWITIFSIHSNPPKINLKKYYRHLMIAHIIFGIGVAVGFKLFDG